MTIMYVTGNFASVRLFFSLHKCKNKLLVEHQVTFDTFRTAYLGGAVLPFTVDAVNVVIHCLVLSA